MLKYILGGIALAAVGYSVKEYCEDETKMQSNNDKQDKPETDIILSSFLSVSHFENKINMQVDDKDNKIKK